MTNTKLQELIKDGNNLFEKINDESFFLFEKPMYELWLNRGLDFIGRDKISATNPFKKYKSEMWSTIHLSEPLISSGSDTTIVYAKKQKKPVYSVADFSDLFEKQIDFLLDLAEKSIHIIIEKNGLITNSLTEKSHKYSSGFNLFKMIVCLAKKGDFVNGTTLRKEVGYHDLSTLKDGIERVNKTLQEEIGVKDLIVHPSYKSGYRINPEYKVDLK